MKVRELVKMFSPLQDVQIYGTFDSKYPGEFYYESELDELAPLHNGKIKDMPFYLAECTVFECVNEDTIDCRRHPTLPGGTVLVFSVEPPDGI